MNQLIVAFVVLISPLLNHVTGSDVVTFTATDPDIVVDHDAARVAVGIVVSRVPVKVIPDATTWELLPPEYTMAL